MGWATSTYKRVYKADVNRDDLKMYFQRLYYDGRDEMSDCLQPSWEPEDKFIITIVSTKSWEEVTHYEDMILTRTRVKELDRLVFNTTSKEVANYLWYLAAKMGASYEQIKMWLSQMGQQM